MVRYYPLISKIINNATVELSIFFLLPRHVPVYTNAWQFVRMVVGSDAFFDWVPRSNFSSASIILSIEREAFETVLETKRCSYVLDEFLQ